MSRVTMWLVAVAIAAVAINPGGFQVAQAAPSPTCAWVEHTSTAGILTTQDGEPGGPASNARATLASDGVGVVAELPDALSKVLWLQPTPAGTRLADVTALRVSMKQNVPGSTFLASYQLVINPSPNDASPGAVHFTTLVWEPYKNGYTYHAGFRTYVLNPDGPEGWWSTRTLSAVPGAVAGAQAPFSLGTYLRAYPDATVLAYGWNLGKGSAGLSTTVGALRFGTTDECAIHVWAAPPTIAFRKDQPIEARRWDHGNVGWIKPIHSTFEAELVADYTNVGPAGSALRAAQVRALATRNAAHSNTNGSPRQPLIFLPGTL